MISVIIHLFFKPIVTQLDLLLLEVIIGLFFGVIAGRKLFYLTCKTYKK